MGEKRLQIRPGFLLPEGFDRSPADPNHAVNPKTGQKAVWDDDTGRWTDEKTGDVLPLPIID